jgi:hypothetical protein
MNASQPHRALRRVAGRGLAIVACALATSVTLPAGTLLAGASSASTARSTPASAAAVLKAVAAAPKLAAIPSTLTPSINSFANPSKAYVLSGVSTFQDCDGYNSPQQQKHPTPCLFGDRHGKKTIVLVGDSFVGNWTPALKLGLKARGYKFDVFGYAGCPTPDLTYRSNQLTASQTVGCNEWHTRVLTAIRRLHPFAIIVATGEDFPSGISNQQWTAGFKKLFTVSTAGSPSTIRIVMGTSPFFSEEVPSCLAAHSNPQDCSTPFPAGSGYGQYLTRDAAAAKGSSATLIRTYPWFCTAKTCSVVISHYLAFADTDHVTVAYSDYLAPVVTDAVLAALTHT